MNASQKSQVLTAEMNRAAGSPRARFLSSQSGQSLIELALMLPLLILMLLGTVEMGRYAYMAILLGNSARAGAAFGAQGLAYSVDTPDITNAATVDFQNGQSLTGLTVTSTTTCGCDSAGTTTSAACTGAGAGKCATGHWVVTVTVTSTATFKSIFKWPGIPQSIGIARSATMRVNQI